MRDDVSAHAERGEQAAGSLPARALACFLVVLVHVNILVRPAMDDWWPGGFALAPLYGIPVPLFFFLSGYASRLKRLDAPFFKTYRRRIARLVLPFFAWNLIVVLVEFHAELLSGESLFLLLTGAWQMYFVFVLFQLHLAALLIERHLDRVSIRAIVISALVLSLSFYALADAMLWEFGAVAGVMEAKLQRLLFPWAAFYACGLLLRHEPELIDVLKARRQPLAAITLSFFVAYFAELRLESDSLGFNPLKMFLLTGFFFQLSATLLAFSLLRELPLKVIGSRLSRVVSLVGRDAYAIYLSHTFILLVLVYCYDRQPIVMPFQLEVSLFAVATLLSSMALARTVRMLPWKIPGMILFGIKGSRKESGVG